ncbi:ER degradation enhancer, mannosidase alpha-like 2 isoform X2 [Oratosquilla oratoria]|uniref:ER degradation enhancer, mannosidase alpha-like 2 isoform X2 n=1 Tax=Oratosquilla oratoria TaxID=337810 RepID=UPI003F777C33
MYSTVCGGVLWWIFLGWLVIAGSCLSPQGQSMPMGPEERLALKEEAREMFYHAYNSYMDNAFPADELMPLSCRGRWRDTEPSRGDIDDALGNFTLTLVDTLDTLVVLGDIEEFDRAVRLIIRHVSFDHDIIVSVFETNIRMVGGLISAHVLAEHLNQLYGSLNWYRGELLTMAEDIASRLLPAFNTTTGIPHARVNLKYGMKSPKLQSSRETCTACAGTIILEFAALSRLTGNAVFEEKARQALDYLWGQRHRGSDLVGTVLNVHSGDWVRRDSGVGAGIDSYYEYLLKAYVLLGDESYLERFNKHYQAVMKYVSQGPMLLDVHMHRPHTTARNFMDALLAFWPGLQVLKGDIKPAIETHEMLFQVIQRHNFLPEAFTTDFQVHWGQHPLRPEFVESTYLLHQATNDPYYLRVGEQVLRSLQKHAWVPCGYAAVKDVRTGGHEDRMDSFVLTETFKYLYLLFSDPSDLIIDMDEFVFTTEAHLLPLSLARLSNLTAVPLREGQEEASDQDVEYSRSCPNAHFLFPGHHEFAATIRQPLKNFVNNVCPSRKTLKRKLRASEFQAGNSGHMGLLRDMGIAIMALPDGRVQLLHTSSNAKSSEDAEEGLMFMQEMIELSKMQQEQPDNPPRMVSFVRWGPDGRASTTTIRAGPAQFGLDLKDNIEVKGVAVIATPIKACEDLTNGGGMMGKVVIMERGDCMFIDKARRIEALGAVGGIVLDNNEGTSAASSPMFAMSGDGADDVNIPLVFLFSADAQILLQALGEGENLEVVLADYRELEELYAKDRRHYLCFLLDYVEDCVFQTSLPKNCWKSNHDDKEQETKNALREHTKPDTKENLHRNDDKTRSKESGKGLKRVPDMNRDYVPLGAVREMQKSCVRSNLKCRTPVLH